MQESDVRQSPMVQKIQQEHHASYKYKMVMLNEPWKNTQLAKFLSYASACADNGEDKTVLQMLLHEASVLVLISDTKKFDAFFVEKLRAHNISIDAMPPETSQRSTVEMISVEDLAKQFGLSITRLRLAITIDEQQREVKESHRQYIETGKWEALQTIRDKSEIIAEGYLELGNTYLPLMDLSAEAFFHPGEYWVRAATFYQMALRVEERLHKEKMGTPLSWHRPQIEEKLLRLLHDISKAAQWKACAREDLTLGLAKNLSTLREHTKGQAEKHPAWTLNCDEKAYAQGIEDWSVQLTVSLKDLLKTFLQSIMALAGEPPCSYSFIGFGSLDKGTMTPYSDFEFGILLSRSTKEEPAIGAYFRWISYFIQCCLINLGESLVLYTWCYHSFDDLLRSGFCFDLGGKSPLGRYETDKGETYGKLKYDLMLTPQELAQYAEDSAFAIDRLLPVEVVNFTVLHEHYITPDQPALGKLASQLIDALMEKYLTNGWRQYEQRACDLLAGRKELKSDVEVYNPTLDSFDREGKLYDVKKEIYRLPDRLIDDVGFYYNVRGGSNFEKLRRLQKLGHITVEAEHHLRVITALAIEMRLRTYLKVGFQQERAGYREWKETTGYFCFNESQLERFYLSALPFYAKAQQFVQLLSAPPSSLKPEDIQQFFSRERYYEERNELSHAQVAFRCAEYSKAEAYLQAFCQKNPHHYQAQRLQLHIFIRQHKAKEAIKCYKHIRKVCKKELDSQQEVQKQLIEVEYAQALVMTTRWEEGLSIYAEAVSILKAKESPLSLPVYRQIIDVCEKHGLTEEKEKWQRERTAVRATNWYNQNREISRGFRLVEEGLEWLQKAKQSHALAEYAATAIQKLAMARGYYEEYYGPSHVETARLLRYLAQSYVVAEKTSLSVAIAYLKTAVDMEMLIHGEGSPIVVDGWRELARWYKLHPDTTYRKKAYHWQQRAKTADIIGKQLTLQQELLLSGSVGKSYEIWQELLLDIAQMPMARYQKIQQLFFSSWQAGLSDKQRPPRLSHLILFRLLCRRYQQAAHRRWDWDGRQQWLFQSQQLQCLTHVLMKGDNTEPLWRQVLQQIISDEAKKCLMLPEKHPAIRPYRQDLDELLDTLAKHLGFSAWNAYQKTQETRTTPWPFSAVSPQQLKKTQLFRRQDGQSYPILANVAVYYWKIYQCEEDVVPLYIDLASQKLKADEKSVIQALLNEGYSLRAIADLQQETRVLVLWDSYEHKIQRKERLFRVAEELQEFKDAQAIISIDQQYLTGNYRYLFAPVKAGRLDMTEYAEPLIDERLTLEILPASMTSLASPLLPTIKIENSREEKNSTPKTSVPANVIHKEATNAMQKAREQWQLPCLIKACDFYLNAKQIYEDQRLPVPNEIWQRLAEIYEWLQQGKQALEYYTAIDGAEIAQIPRYYVLQEVISSWKLEEKIGLPLPERERRIQQLRQKVLAEAWPEAMEFLEALLQEELMPWIAEAWISLQPELLYWLSAWLTRPNLLPMDIVYAFAKMTRVSQKLASLDAAILAGGWQWQWECHLLGALRKSMELQWHGEFNLSLNLLIKLWCHQAKQALLPDRDLLLIQDDDIRSATEKMLVEEIATGCQLIASFYGQPKKPVLTQKASSPQTPLAIAHRRLEECLALRQKMEVGAEATHEIYVPLMARQGSDGEREELQEITTAFLKAVPKRLLLLSGISGSGKSRFLSELEKMQWQHYEFGCDAKVPWRILLREFDSQEISTHLRCFLTRQGYSENALRWWSQQNILLLWDGYDEIREITGKNRINLYQTQQLSEWKTLKVIITCRTQDLPALAEKEKTFAPLDKNGKAAPWEEIQIARFDNTQRDDYLKEWSTVCAAKSMTIVEVQQYINDTQGLARLLDTPLVLQLFTETLPFLLQQARDPAHPLRDLNAWTLYENFITQWFEREQLRQEKLGWVTTELFSLFDKYSRQLACQMLIKQCQSLNLDSEIIEEAWERFFQAPKEKKELGKSGSPLLREGNHYRFVYQAFQDYFAAREITELLREKNWTALDQLFSQRLVSHEVGLWNFIHDWYENTFSSAQERKIHQQEVLHKLVFPSRQLKPEEKTPTAANVITLLNYSGFHFSGQDLSGMQIAGADLRYMIADAARFDDADFSGVRLEQAYFPQASFRQAKFKGVQLGVKPTLKTPTSLVAISYNHTIKKFAIAEEKNTVSIWDGKQLYSTKIQDTKGLKLAFDYSGKWLACIGSNNIIYIINTTTRNDTYKKIENLNSKPLALCFSHDAKQLFYILENKEFFVSDITGYNRPVDRILLHKSIRIRNVNNLIIEEKTNNLVTAGKKRIAWIIPKKDVYAKNISMRYQLKLASWKETRAPEFITCLCSNSKILAAGGDNNIYLFNALDQELYKSLAGHQENIQALIFDCYGEQLISGSIDGEIRLWNVQTHSHQFGQCIYRIQEHHAPIAELYFYYENDESWLLSADKTGVVRDRLLSKSFNQNKTFSHDAKIIYLVDITGTNFWMSGDANGIFKKWEKDSGKLKAECNLFLTVPEKNKTGNALEFFLEIEKYLWHANTAYQKIIVKPSLVCKIKTLAPHPKQNLLVQAVGTKLLIHENGTFRSLLDLQRSVNILAWQPGENQLACATNDALIVLVNPFQLPVSPVLLEGHTCQIVALAWHPEGKFLLSGSNSGEIFIWKKNRGNNIWQIRDKVSSDDTKDSAIVCLAWSSDGEYSAFATIDQIISVYDLAKKSLFLRIKSPWKISQIAFGKISDFPLLIAGGENGELLWWRLSKKAVLLASTTTLSLTCDGANFKDTLFLEEFQKEVLAQGNAKLNEPLEKAVMSAVKQGDLVRLQKIISINKIKHLRGHYRNEKLQTPLHVACCYGHSAIVKWLLDEKLLEVNSIDKLCQTPLHYAATFHKNSCAKMLLLNERIDISLTNQFKETPLHIATANGNIILVKEILSYATVKCKNKDFLLKEDAQKSNALHIASRKQNSAIFKILFQTIQEIFIGKQKKCALKSYLRSREYNGFSALHSTVRAGNFEIVAFFVQEIKSTFSTEAEEEIKYYLLDDTNNNGNSILNSAMHAGNPEVVNFLLRLGLEILKESDSVIIKNYLMRKNNQGFPPLHSGIYWNKEESMMIMINFVKTLKDKSILQEILSATDSHENSSLNLSSKEGFFNITKFLIETAFNGMDAEKFKNYLTHKNKNQFSPLHSAVYLNNYNIAKLLLEYLETALGGRDTPEFQKFINQQNIFYHTPLDDCNDAEKENIALKNLLLSYGAKLSVTSETPLSTAGKSVIPQGKQQNSPKITGKNHSMIASTTQNRNNSSFWTPSSPISTTPSRGVSVISSPRHKKELLNNKI